MAHIRIEAPSAEGLQQAIRAVLGVPIHTTQKASSRLENSMVEKFADMFGPAPNKADSSSALERVAKELNVNPSQLEASLARHSKQQGGKS